MCVCVVGYALRGERAGAQSDCVAPLVQTLQVHAGGDLEARCPHGALLAAFELKWHKRSLKVRRPGSATTTATAIIPLHTTMHMQYDCSEPLRVTAAPSHERGVMYVRRRQALLSNSLRQNENAGTGNQVTWHARRP